MADKMVNEKSQLGWLFGLGTMKYGKCVLWVVIALYLISLIICVTAALRSFADVIVLLGAFWLGALIGVLLGFFVQDSEHWDKRALGVSALAIAGSFVFLFLRYLGDTHEIWLYPMGLVGGFIIGTIWKYAHPPE